MKAIVHDRYGPPDVLRMEEVPTPVPGKGEALVKVRATSVNAGDWHLMRADPWFVRLFAGLTRPKHRILGADVAGVVEAVGADVKGLRAGDEVYADLSGCGFGGFAEYACVPDAFLAPKPRNLTFEEAAAVPSAATTALQGLRGRVEPGRKVLIHGASGGVGTFAVQLAKAMGAEVTGVCSTRNVEMVHSIGADRVIDYKREYFARGGERYDLILDVAAYRSPLGYRRALAPEGRYVMVGGSVARMFQVMFLSLASRRIGSMGVKHASRDDLLALKGMIEAGKVRPVIDRSYPLARVPDAIRYLEEEHARAKVVITV